MPTNGIIRVIAGGIVARGHFNALKKAYVRAVYNINSEHKRVGTYKQIIFSYEDLRGIQSPHDDVVLISVVVANFEF